MSISFSPDRVHYNYPHENDQKQVIRINENGKPNCFFLYHYNGILFTQIFKYIKFKTKICSVWALILRNTIYLIKKYKLLSNPSGD